MKSILRTIQILFWNFFNIQIFNKYKNPPRNLIISPGGVATTMLINYLSKYIQVNDPNDKDLLKHLTKLPSNLNKHTKILYIYGDTKSIFLSLKRRNYFYSHCLKMNCLKCLFFQGGLQYKFFEDRINYQKNLLTKNQNYQLLVLSYDEIWTKKNKIKKFFKISSKEFIDRFPQKKSRVTKE